MSPVDPRIPPVSPRSGPQAAPAPTSRSAARRPTLSAHGEKDDPRYPSPRRLRRALAFVVDFALTFLVGVVGGFVAFGGDISYGRFHLHLPERVHLGAVSHYGGLSMLGLVLAVSFANRVLIQWIARATVGKALFGLWVVDPSDGRRASLWLNVKSWLMTLVVLAEAIGSTSTGAGGGHRFPAAVRMRDVRALKRHTPTES